MKFVRKNSWRHPHWLNRVAVINKSSILQSIASCSDSKEEAVVGRLAVIVLSQLQQYQESSA